MKIVKGRVYLGAFHGKAVQVMPTAVNESAVAFWLGQPFGSRTIFDGSQRDSMAREQFENSFTLLKTDESEDDNHDDARCL